MKGGELQQNVFDDGTTARKEKLAHKEKRLTRSVWCSEIIFDGVRKWRKGKYQQEEHKDSLQQRTMRITVRVLGHGQIILNQLPSSSHFAQKIGIIYFQLLVPSIIFLSK